jgi:hypothetical protein
MSSFQDIKKYIIILIKIFKVILFEIIKNLAFCFYDVNNFV